MKYNPKSLRKAKHVLAAKLMPELDHWPGRSTGEEWSSERSEVIQWLVKQTEIMNWVMDHMKRRGAIRFNAEKKKWVGTGKDTVESGVAALEVKPGNGVLPELTAGDHADNSASAGVERGIDAFSSEPGFKPTANTASGLA